MSTVICPQCTYIFTEKLTHFVDKMNIHLNVENKYIDQISVIVHIDKTTCIMFSGVA